MTDTAPEKHSKGHKHLQLSNKDEVSMHCKGEGCIVYEYNTLPTPFDNLAEARILNNYPSQGYVVNELCNECIYVASGRGKICLQNDGYNNFVSLEPSDVLFIPKGQKFKYIVGPHNGLRVLITTNPKWTPDQHKRID